MASLLTKVQRAIGHSAWCSFGCINIMSSIGLYFVNKEIATNTSNQLVTRETDS